MRAVHALSEAVAQVEWEREKLARAVSCRVCGAAPGAPCRTTIPSPTSASGEIGKSMPNGHTGRYTDARAAGVLPPTHCRVCGDGAH